jgi:hypothetical protein
MTVAAAMDFWWLNPIAFAMLEDDGRSILGR